MARQARLDNKGGFKNKKQNCSWWHPLPNFFPFRPPSPLSQLQAKPCSYKSPKEVADDVAQVFANCRLYNAPHQDVVKLCADTEEFFRSRWEKADLLTKWEAELDRHRKEVAWLENQRAQAAAPAHRPPPQ